MKHLPIRCECSARPILAIARLSEDGKWVIHVRAYKQHRIYAEVVIDSGSPRIRCRECLRWHQINIKRARVEAVETSPPSEIPLPE